MSYQKNTTGSQTVFDCTPEPLPEGTSMVKGALAFSNILGAAMIAFVLMFVGGCTASQFLAMFGTLGYAVGGLLGTILGIYVGIRMYKRSQKRSDAGWKRHREATRFSVSPDGISLNGKTFPTKDVYRVVSRNHVLEAIGEPSETVVVGGSMGSRISTQSRNAGYNAGRAQVRELAKVSYRVEFEAGGVAYLLAGGLTDAGAFAISSDVSQILGLAG